MPYKSERDRQHYQKKFDEQRKQTHRHVKLTLAIAQYRSFQRVAAHEGKSVAKIMLDLAETKMNDTTFVPKILKDSLDEITMLLRGCGTGIYQIAQKVHQEEEVEEVLKRIFEMLVMIEEEVKKKLA